MMRGMLAAVSGLKAHETMLDVVSNNIANVNTVGYKSSRTSFEDAFSQTLRGASAPSGTGGAGGIDPTQIGLGVQLGGVESEMTEGSIQSTGVPLDAAIQGNGFFCVSQSAPPALNTLYYTRNGDFTTDSNGHLITRDGNYVVSQNVGLITVPANASSVSIGADGTVTAIVNGAETSCGQIGLRTFRNEGGLMHVAGSRFADSPNDGANTNTGNTLFAPNDPANGTGSLVAGALEMSNVDLASEFTNMIVAERGFQANSRAITTADEMLQELVNLKH